MHCHSTQECGIDISATGSLWPDCEIEVDPYRLPAHITFAAPCSKFSNRMINRTVSIYKDFVVIVDKFGLKTSCMRILALREFAGIVVRVGFSQHGYRQIGSAVYLHHKALGLELPIYAAIDCDDTVGYWLAWSRSLGIPAMSLTKDGELFDPFHPVSAQVVKNVSPTPNSACEIIAHPAISRKPTEKTPPETAGNISMIAAEPGSNQSNVYSLFG